jgi:hypothetical protein
MASTLTLTGTLADDIGLMYFNPSTESLKEIDEQSVYIACKSYSYCIKRFYLCGSLLEYSNTITIRTSLNDESLYYCKVIAGLETANYSSFQLSTNQVTLDSSLLGGVYTNAIPVDILVESTNLTEKTIILNIELISDSNVTPIACVPTTLKRTLTPDSTISANPNIGDKYGLNIYDELDGSMPRYMYLEVTDSDGARYCNYNVYSNGTLIYQAENRNLSTLSNILTHLLRLVFSNRYSNEDVDYYYTYDVFDYPASNEGISIEVRGYPENEPDRRRELVARTYKSTTHFAYRYVKRKR